MTLDRIPRPAEGWLPVVLVAVMVLIVGWVLDDPAWVIGSDTYTDFLPTAALLGAFAAFVGAKVGWSRWLVHLIAATFGALIVPILVGWAVDPELAPGAAFQRTAEGSVQAYLDLAWYLRDSTRRVEHFILLLGIVAWASGQFAAYAVFGHRRPLNAVILLGIVIVANMSMTLLDQLGFLVLFSAASLFLLIAMHAFDERTTWVRRRIGDPSGLPGLLLRGGTLFVTVAIVGSVLLTAQASSSPLAGVWSGLDQRLIAIGQQIQRIVPVGGAGRTLSPSFGDVSRIPDRWDPSETTISFRAEFTPGDTERYYWRAAAYDRFEYPRTWTQSAVDEAIVAPPGAAALADTVDAPSEERTRSVTYTIRPDAYTEQLVLAPLSVVSIDQETRIAVIPESRTVSRIERSAGGPYTVTAAVALVTPNDTDGVNANYLRSLPDDYPREIASIYLGDTSESVPAGGNAEALLEHVREIAPKREDGTIDPYDLAATMQAYFRSDAFRYTIDISDLDCSEIGIAECFALHRRGFCEQYATTMTVLLRHAGIPARYVKGFLPGDRELGSGVETVYQKAAHAWLEVYFPGYGWYPFDPTGGGVGQLEALPPGPAQAAPTPSPRASGGVVLPTRPPEREEPGGTGGGGGTIDRPSDPLPLAIVAVLLAILVGGLMVATWWRGPRGEVTPESAWRTVGRIAARLGFAPRPTQTVYEYAGTLGELVPLARPDLETVAKAKVEVAYGRSELTGDRLRVLREANRRLRVTLLRLALRRRDRARGVRHTR